MTKITPTDAIKMSGKARQTIYDAMERGDLSFEQAGPRKRLIDVAELERWNGGLKPAGEGRMSGDVSGRQTRTSESDKAGNAGAENAALQEKIAMLDEERRRERELLQEQIEDLKQTLRTAHEHQTRLTALLTDQRHQKAEKQAQEQAQLIRDLRIGQARLRKELQEVREHRGLFARWLGAGGRKKNRQPRPPQPAAS